MYYSTLSSKWQLKQKSPVCLILDFIYSTCIDLLIRVSNISLSIFSFLNLHSPKIAVLSIVDIPTTSISADCWNRSPFASIICSTPHQVPTSVINEPVSIYFCKTDNKASSFSAQYGNSSITKISFSSLLDALLVIISRTLSILGNVALLYAGSNTSKTCFENNSRFLSAPTFVAVYLFLNCNYFYMISNNPCTTSTTFCISSKERFPSFL